jgi:hypothetical protein
MNRNADGQATLVLVAAAGGGIRAAYWTAAVLAKLNEIPDFRRHLFAISSVSGGSLGAALYRASLTSIDRNKSGCSQPTLLDCYKAFLSRDFLAPLLAGWLFSDTVATFAPFLPLPDRANAIERAWEAAWKNVFGNDLFSEDFISLWPRSADVLANDPGIRKADLFPALILNVTSLNSGMRDAVSNIGNGGSILSNISMPLSVAVNASARFPFLEPPGMLSASALENVKALSPLLHNIDTRSMMFDYFVDGGYADNFGAAAIDEILSSVKKINCEPLHGAECKREAHTPWIEAIVIQITNDQSIIVDGSNAGRCITPPEGRSGSLPIKVSEVPRFNELVSPLLVLTNARETMGLAGARMLKDRADYYLHFRLSTMTRKDYKLAPGLSYPDDTQPPFASLNWVLSPTSQHQIDGRLPQCGKLRAVSISQVLQRKRTVEAVSDADRRVPILTDNWPDDW